MKNYYLSPSLLVADLLRLGDIIQQLDEVHIDMFHIDIVDTTFAASTGLPTSIFSAIRSISGTPFDIHLMIEHPERLLPALYPYIQDSYVSVHIETTKEANWIANEIRKKGGKPGIALNSSTPIAAISEVLPCVDIVTVMMCDAARDLHLPGIREKIFKKVQDLRQLCHSIHRSDILLQCDAGITFEEARRLLLCGADSFVLGRDSIFFQKKSPGKCVQSLRAYLQS